MRAKLFRYLIFLFPLFVSISCIEEYWPEITRYHNLLVVDGIITNSPGPYTIKLSYSSPVNDPEFTPASNAEVQVVDNKGNIYAFRETQAGIYLSENFTAEAGEKYKLEINFPGGKAYATRFYELHPSPPIDSITTEIATKATTDPNYDKIGYQFYVSTHDPENKQLYYLWRLSETYEYHASLIAEYYFAGAIFKNLHPFENYFCWKTQDIDEYFVYDASHLKQLNLTQIPLHYVSTESKRLSVKYSPLVKQYAINKEAYIFYSNIKEQQTKDGNLYSKQPFYVKGNVKCISNPDEKVLGFFLVAGEFKKRSFYSRPAVPFYYPVCEADPERMKFIYQTPKEAWPVYIAITNDGVLGAAASACFDCRTFGGTITKPDFWP